MLTNYKFYEGVPVGPDNFSEFYSTLFKNSDSIMLLAFASGGTTEINTTGGHLQTNPVGYKLIRSSTGTYFYVLSGETAKTEKDATGSDVFSVDNSKGVLFAKTSKRYFTEEIPYIRSPGTAYGTTEEQAIEDMRVYSWETIATGFDTTEFLNSRNLVYKANIPLSPYRVVKELSNSAEGYTYKIDQGIMDFRYNGIPQPQINGNDTRFYTPSPASKSRYVGRGAYSFGSLQNTNQVTIGSNLILGAEYPHPLSKGQFKFGTVEGLNRSDWISAFGTESQKYIEVKFPFANFTTEQAQIIVKRSFDQYYDNKTGEIYTPEPKYLHIQEDVSGGLDVRDGFFKVMDKAKGIIRLNVSQTLIMSYLRLTASEVISDIRFTIVCPEQLLESYEEDSTTRYRTRYGKVFTGSYLDTELVSVSFEPKTGRFSVNRITEGINNEDGTDVLYVDRSASVKTMLLALSYPAKPKIETEPQKLKYIPDILSMFYIAAVPASNTTGENVVSKVEDIVAYVEVNKASWYNQDVKAREYKPVARAERAFISLASSKANIGNGAVDGVGNGGDKLTVLTPLKPVFRYNSGPSENYYVHKTKVGLPQNIGKKEEYVRRDAALPEPHYINPPIIKMFLQSGESLHITEGHQMIVRRKYTIQNDAVLKVDGYLFVD